MSHENTSPPYERSPHTTSVRSSDETPSATRPQALSSCRDHHVHLRNGSCNTLTTKTMKLKLKTIETIRKLGFHPPENPQPRTNPFTGVTHTLEPDAVQLYDFITTRKYVCGRDYTRSEWDNARYNFQSRWPNEYMDLLD